MSRTRLRRFSCATDDKIVQGALEGINIELFIIVLRQSLCKHRFKGLSTAKLG